ncbi:transketolase [Enterococcus avium]|uniref:transketolase n=1 Tax=Enterococcus avium TaxID=33945 RepID=UPI0037B91DC8
MNDLVTNIRMLSVDMIAKANSGHPGLPLGAAPAATALFANHLKVNPVNPNWMNRDRFVLSAGHGSALLYSLLYCFGYPLTKKDLQNFRQLDSKTPGHPEIEMTEGVDISSGPLGQGIASAVGMAMAEAHLASEYNRDKFSIIDHYTYCLVGDGCLMEGISSEAMSVAGNLKLNKLIVLYDSNDITLDGNLDYSSKDDVEKRCEAYHWDYILVEDGNNLDKISEAISSAKKTEKPVLIEIKSVIGFGSLEAGTSKVHGNPIVGDDLKNLKEFYNWTLEDFELSNSVKNFQKEYLKRGQTFETSWLDSVASYQEKYPEMYRQLMKDFSGNYFDEVKNMANPFGGQNKLSTREASGIVLNQLAEKLPLFGGSADLASSNKTYLNGKGDFSDKSYQGSNIWFGIREFFMGAAMNGISLHGGLISFGATFFVFSDYLKSAIRSAALMKLPVIYVMTHDSVAVGEDGPTHQPIEQIAGFRATPNLRVFRPADANETFSVYQYILEKPEMPSMVVLSRQDLPNVTPLNSPIKNGAYILKDSSRKPDFILVATGSEVSLALEIESKMPSKSIRVVSMPSQEIFSQQSDEYKESVLPRDILSFSIECGSTYGWHEYVDYCFGIDSFGKSAPATELVDDYRFTSDALVEDIYKILKGLPK